MPLTLVTTAGASDANAYADRASVVALAAFRGAPGAAFLELSEDQQVQAIATTAAEIDSFDYDGARLSTDQAMEHPRTVASLADMVRANRELAIARAASFADGATVDPLTPTIDRVKRDKTGPLETEYFAPATVDAASISTLPPVVQRLISRWLRSNVEILYGTSTAVRGS